MSLRQWPKELKIKQDISLRPPLSSAITADRMAPAPPSAAPGSEEAKVLADALNTVKIQVVQMKRYLVSHSSAEPQ
jgi:hypothetical protein